MISPQADITLYTAKWIPVDISANFTEISIFCIISVVILVNFHGFMYLIYLTRVQ